MLNDEMKQESWSPRDNIKLETPLPLFRELPPANPYPLDALGNTLQAAAETMKEVIQAPDALYGQSLLGAAALAVQPHANVVRDGSEFPCSLFLLSVGKSGERKSAIDSIALKAHREVEQVLIDQYEDELKIYSRDCEAWDTAKKRVLTQDKNKKTKEDFQRALAELGPRPEQPYSQIILMDEPTLEGLQKALAGGRPSVGIFSDEGGRMVGGHSMNAENQLKTVAGFCQLWDGSPMSRTRAGDGSTKLFGKRLSLHLMLQPRVAEQITSNPVLFDQGFLSRCLIAAPESTAGSRPYRDVDLSQSPGIITYKKLMRELLQVPLPIKSNKNELNPRKIKLAPNAKNLWIVFHDHIEKNLKEGQSFFNISGFASKAAEQVLRLSSVLSLVENIDASEIRHEHLESGIALAEFYLSEALRLHQSAILNPDLVLAKKLLSWCQQFSEVYPVLIYQKGPNSIRDRETAQKLIKILDSYGWLRKIPEGKEVDGKFRKDVWEVVHEIYS